MMADANKLFEDWIGSVAMALRTAAARVTPRPRILLKQNDAGAFVARVVSNRNGVALPQSTFRPGQEAAMTGEWRGALRGSQLEIHMRTDQVLFRAIDFPKQAADFLDGMVRAQIDRLTPWTADDAAFGMTGPVPVASERIAMTLAATSRRTVQPLLDLAADLGAASVEVIRTKTNEPNEACDRRAATVASDAARRWRWSGCDARRLCLSRRCV